MNILDENIPEDQRQLLRSWDIRVRQIGHERVATVSAFLTECSCRIPSHLATTAVAI